MNLQIPPRLQKLRGEMKKSRFKIWLRAGLLILFSLIFGLYLIRDISAGYFRWEWALPVFIICLPIGFWMSRLVPMRADTEIGAVLLSFDRIYFTLIWVLVIAKLIIGNFPRLTSIADFVMCIILGIMSGRLGGIGVRVRELKKEI